MRRSVFALWLLCSLASLVSYLRYRCVVPDHSRSDDGISVESIRNLGERVSHARSLFESSMGRSASWNLSRVRVDSSLDLMTMLDSVHQRVEALEKRLLQAELLRWDGGQTVMAEHVAEEVLIGHQISRILTTRANLSPNARAMALRRLADLPSGLIYFTVDVECVWCDTVLSEGAQEFETALNLAIAAHRVRHGPHTMAGLLLLAQHPHAKIRALVARVLAKMTDHQDIVECLLYMQLNDPVRDLRDRATSILEEAGRRDRVR